MKIITEAIPDLAIVVFKSCPDIVMICLIERLFIALINKKYVYVPIISKYGYE